MSDTLFQFYGLTLVLYLYKEKLRIGDYTAKLTFLWYDNFGKKGSMPWNGMAAIPKI